MSKRNLLTDIGVCLAVAILTAACGNMEGSVSGLYGENGRVIVTGFQNWAGSGQAANPTEQMIRSGELQQQLQSMYQADGREYPADRYQFVVLPLTTNNQYGRAEVVGGGQQDFRNQDVRNYVSLGVDPNNTNGEYRLEQYAVNRFQDPASTNAAERRGTTVQSGGPQVLQANTYDQAFVNNTNSELSKGASLELGGKGDTGTFYCNRQFYNALSDVNPTGVDANGNYSNKPIQADFIHVPTNATATDTARIIYNATGGPGEVRTGDPVTPPEAAATPPETIPVAPTEVPAAAPAEAPAGG